MISRSTRFFVRVLLLFVPFTAAARPNILVIITDDQGWADIGYNNPENVHTPNLDRLAAGG